MLVWAGVCFYVLRIISMDKILRFINTLIIAIIIKIQLMHLLNQWTQIQ